MHLYRIIFKDGKPSQFIEAFDLDTVQTFMRSLGYTEPQITIQELT